MLQDMEKEELIEWNGGTGGRFTKADVIAMLTVMQRDVLSIMVYKKSLCALIEEVRDGGEGSDAALMNAVRIDRTVVTCPSVAARISQAEAMGETGFFLRLRSALNGPSIRTGRERLLIRDPCIGPSFIMTLNFRHIGSKR